jgi:hypothetical protein
MKIITFIHGERRKNFNSKITKELRILQLRIKVKLFKNFIRVFIKVIVNLKQFQTQDMHQNQKKIK